MLLKVVQDPNNTITTIDHKFLVSGHSYLPNDDDFGVIKNASPYQNLIYSPEQWVSIIKNGKRKEPRSHVTEMKHTDFFSTKNLDDAITNRKKTVCDYSFNWLNIRWLRFEKNHPLQFKFKESLNTDIEFYSVDLSKKPEKRQNLYKEDR